MAQLPMPTSGRGMPPDPGGHTKLALIDLRFVPPSWNLLSKVEEPPDVTQDSLFPVPGLTASYHYPDATTEVTPWPEFMTSKDKIPMF